MASPGEREGLNGVVDRLSEFDVMLIVSRGKAECAAYGTFNGLQIFYFLHCMSYIFHLCKVSSLTEVSRIMPLSSEQALVAQNSKNLDKDVCLRPIMYTDLATKLEGQKVKFGDQPDCR